MKELLCTGFMSNRGRQIVASYLVNDLGLDWRFGAEYFEQQLLDHDPAVNYGNWAYIAGVGADARQNRYFSIPKQSKLYDPHGIYVKTWLTQLKSPSFKEANSHQKKQKNLIDYFSQSNNIE